MRTLLKDRTKSAFTVIIEVISLGSSARLVSPRQMRKTIPKGLSSVLEGVLTTGRDGLLLPCLCDRLLVFEEVDAVSASDMIPGSSSSNKVELTKGRLRESDPIGIEFLERRLEEE